MTVIRRARKIVLRNFHGIDEHVYEDELGWRQWMKDEARSCISKEIFEYYVVGVGFNLLFYYIDDDTFYGIYVERYPVEVRILNRDRTKEFLEQQLVSDVYESDEVIASFDNECNIWDNLMINGKPLEVVLRRSYIIGLD